MGKTRTGALSSSWICALPSARSTERDYPLTESVPRHAQRDGAPMQLRAARILVRDAATVRVMQWRDGGGGRILP